VNTPKTDDTPDNNDLQTAHRSREWQFEPATLHFGGCGANVAK
jgi:hypothetical protein